MHMDFTAHCRAMLQERAIPLEWVERTVGTPDRVEQHPGGLCHFLKKISEHDDRWLRVVVNVNAEPNRVVTAFFDRRMERKP